MFHTIPHHTYIQYVYANVSHHAMCCAVLWRCAGPDRWEEKEIEKLRKKKTDLEEQLQRS